MGDLAVFSTKRGLERVWVPGGEEDEWIRRFGRSGEAAARWRDYIAWGRRFYPVSVEHVMLRNELIIKRPRRSYRATPRPTRP